MIKLTATHLGILTAANERVDGLAVRPAALKPSSAMKMAAKLVEQGLCREVRAKAEMPIWREDEHGKPFSLKILKAARVVVEAARQAEEPASADTQCAESPLTCDREAEAPGSKGNGSKRNLVVAMMQRHRGATIDDLMSATGWLPHTTRAALSGLRKKGFAIIRSRESNDQNSVYKIASPVAETA
jgi:hypothetical protein